MSAYYAEIDTNLDGNLLDGFLTLSSGLVGNDGTNQTVPIAYTHGGANKVAISYDAAVGNMACNLNGNWSADAVYDGTLLQGILDLFRTGSGAEKIRNLQRYDLPYDEAKAKIDELMGGA